MDRSPLLLRPAGSFLVPSHHIARSITRRSLPGGMQSLEKCHECSRLRRTQILSVRRHVAAPLNHLANELVLRAPHGNAVESGTSLPAYISEGMTVTALLDLKHQRALALKGGRAMNKSI